MNNKIERAISRLNDNLPLLKNQQALAPGLQQLHRDILNSYMEPDRSLAQHEIAQRIDDAEAALQTLSNNDLVVLDDSGELIGAYPFTTEARDYVIKVDGHTAHCMCALDSLAPAAMYGVALEIHSACYLSGQTILIQQKGMQASSNEDVYFAINWNAASSGTCCAESLCTEMVFIIGESAAKQWCNEDSEHRQMFTLEEAIEFSAGFFVPLIQ